MISQLFKQIKNTPSANDRKKLLIDNLNDTIKLIFEDCYNKDRQYFVKAIPLIPLTNTPSDSWTIDDHYNDFHEVLEELMRLGSNSNKAIALVHDVINKFQLDDREILINILQRNLKIGITNTIMKKILGTSEDKFEVSLATNLDKTNIDPLTGEYFASRKLDGVRCVAFIEVYEEDGIKHTTTPILRSRQNKEFTTLDNLKEPIRLLASNLPIGRYVFDGECCILDDNGDEHFDWIMREIKRKDHTISHPCYNIFDLLTEDEFNNRVESPVFSERLSILTQLYSKYQEVGNTNYIHLLKQERITDQNDFNRWTRYVAEGRWEGFMLRKDVPYKRGRSTDLLKVKKFQDDEYKVLDTINGTVKYGTEVFDTCSAIVINHKGTLVQVGSGLSKENRLDWFEHPEHIIGKTVTIQYFEETHNKTNDQLSLRFPVLKYVYEDERDV